MPTCPKGYYYDAIDNYCYSKDDIYGVKPTPDPTTTTTTNPYQTATNMPKKSKFWLGALVGAVVVYLFITYGLPYVANRKK